MHTSTTKYYNILLDSAASFQALCLILKLVGLYIRTIKFNIGNFAHIILQS